MRLVRRPTAGQSGLKFYRSDGTAVRASLQTGFVEANIMCSLILAIERSDVRVLAAQRGEGKPN
jgi:hypothetical protein